MEAANNSEIPPTTSPSQQAEKATKSQAQAASKTASSKKTKSPKNNKPVSNGKGNHGASGRFCENYGLEQDTYLDRPGTKKTNLNHLLNFNYKSRDPTDSFYEYERSTRSFFSTKLSKTSVFSKEQFLQANCQFVVKEGQDYSVHMVDPDRLVDWSRIEEIHIETLEPISCPICLYEPTCGKMTKCGHIYCWSCILHYLSLSDKAWRKCPICYESIYKQDLKSVQIRKHGREFKVGDEIKMNLMFRFRNKYNTVILPYSLCESFTNDVKKKKNFSFNLFNCQKYSDFRQYFKFFSKTSEQILESVVKRERIELERQVEQDGNQPEVCFVIEALNLLDERQTLLMSEIEKGLKVDAESKVDKQFKIDCPVETFIDAFEDKMEKSAEQIQTTESNAKKTEEQSKESDNGREESSSPSDLTFFYQSNDGQRIYINGLNNRCLMAEYLEFSKCPLTLTAKILAMESLFITEENRKRHKYLAHLPLHSEFKLVELDLKKPVVSQKTLEAFSAEIQERVRMRKRIENRERKEAERIAALNELDPHYFVQSAMNEPVHYIKSVPTEPVLDYETEFPEAGASPPASSGASVSEISTTSSTGGVPSLSFAQMLQISKEAAASNSNAWPSIDSNSASSSGSNQLSGWVTMAKKQTQQQSMLGRSKRSQNPPSPLVNETLAVDQQDEEEMPAPLYKLSFSSAIDQSLNQFESKKNSQQEENLTMQTDKSKKKKKTKQNKLFLDESN
ncbi:RING finger 10 [Brachionus plicatilis]|uniref:E3 ubiquitin-protein ligase RNF10 n=1 Tax=Brachionus plicatilis TaxID=10195 RepID=A0A3M7SCC2_BRAPC|nr:RING finger 10 [Brachionus plicatilis]